MNASIMQGRPDWCAENLSVKNGLTSGFVGESNRQIVQLITTLGASYRTSMSDERSFRSLVTQIKGDTLAEIRYSDLTMLSWLRDSVNVGEWIKSRVELSLRCSR